MNKEILHDEYLPKLHGEILSIMSFIDELCTTHNIRYYLIGGSLLGAVRHQGFIPWDDDLDIVMPREDFNRFISLCNTSLPNPYKYVWLTNEKEYWLPFAKVYKEGTIFQEKECAHKNFGIFVDIFPIDETTGYSKAVDLRKKLIEKLFVIKHIKNGFQKVGFLKRMVAYFTPHYILNKMYFFLSTMTNNNNGEYYTNFGSQYNAKRQTILKKNYGTGVRYVFESEEYIVPSQYIEVLTSIFGEKYIELPPKDKRRTHYPIKVVFSDGTYIVNEVPVNRVVAE